MRNQKFLPTHLFFILLTISISSIVINSCGDSLDHDKLEAVSEAEIELRSVSCTPEGDCDDPFTLTVTLGSPMLPCQVSIEMIITICDGNYNFEEMTVTPDVLGCVLTQEDTDKANELFILSYMTNQADVASCSTSITTHSNYIKKNCVERCLQVGLPGQPSSIVYVPCAGGATGCCIETTTWCEFQGNNIEIAHFAETIPGTCSGNVSAGCIVWGLKNICLEDRCEE